jgi:hypothetical protein
MRVSRTRKALPPKIESKAYVKPVDDLVHIDSRVDYAGIVQKYKDGITNRKTAIRAFCIQCTNGQVKEVLLCPSTNCALHAFRQGDDPFNLKFRKTRGLVEDQGEE